MTKDMLERAHDLIVRKEYAEARSILRQLEDQSTTARRWLENLDWMEPESDEETDLFQAQAAEMQAEREALQRLGAEEVIVLEDDPDEEDRNLPVGAGMEEEDVPSAVDQGEPEEPGVMGPVVVEDNVLPSATDSEDMPLDDNIDILPQDDIRRSETDTSLPLQRWEYREIILRNWEHHMSNIEYALGQGGEKITIEDAYTRLLNENGAQGWEIVSEEVLPQQFVRILMKRPAQS